MGNLNSDWQSFPFVTVTASTWSVFWRNSLFTHLLIYLFIVVMVMSSKHQFILNIWRKYYSVSWDCRRGWCLKYCKVPFCYWWVCIWYFADPDCTYCKHYARCCNYYLQLTAMNWALLSLFISYTVYKNYFISSSCWR